MAGLFPASNDPSDPSANAAPASDPQGSGAPPAGQGGAADQGSVASPTDGADNMPDPDADTPADEEQQMTDGSGAPGTPPRAKGTVEDANKAAVDADPESAIEATPEEQAQYHQLITRFLLFISDMRQSHDKLKSPMQSVLDHMNDPKVPLAVSVGKATAAVAFTIVSAAHAQKVKYDPEVLFHAGDEMVVAMYLLGLANGLFHGMPPFHGLQPDGTYDFADNEIKVIGEAKMQAVRFFGNMLVQHGMITPDDRSQNATFWKEQIDREVKSGFVSDEVMQKLSKQGVFDKIHDHLGTNVTAGSAQAQIGASPNPFGVAPGGQTQPPPDGAQATDPTADAGDQPAPGAGDQPAAGAAPPAAPAPAPDPNAGAQ